MTYGQFEGIGASVEMKNNQVVIEAPIHGSPAQKAGLKPGDVFVKVDGKSVEGQSLQEVVSKVLGPAGTKVDLTMFRPSTNETLNLTITRARIDLHNVTWQKIPGTNLAHLRISEFSKGVSRDLQQASTDIENQHATGIVLDLRENPGGLLDEAVASAK